MNLVPTLDSGVSRTGGARPPGTTGDTAGSLIPAVAWALQERDAKGVDSDTKEGHLIIAPLADPVSAHEGDTYTHEGSGNFRLHNVVPAPSPFRKAQKAHDPEDCERWEEADATDAIDERDARTANAVVQAVSLVERTRDGQKQIESTGDLSYALTNPGQGGRTDSRMVGVVSVDLQNTKLGDEDVAGTLDTTRPSRGGGQAVAFRAAGQDGFTPSEITPPVAATDGGGAGAPTVAATISPRILRNSHTSNEVGIKEGAAVHDSLSTDGPGAVAFHTAGYGASVGEHAATLQASDAELSNQVSGVIEPTMAVRRLTPTECERLQAFPDGWTCLCLPLEEWARDPEAAQERCTCPDSPRYRGMGNAVTTTVVQWIAERIRRAMTHEPRGW